MSVGARGAGRLLVGLAATIGACSPPDTGFTTLVPEIAVAPERVAFGEVGVPLSATSPIYVTNAGKADLEVTELRLEGSGAAAYTVDLTPLHVEPGEDVQLDVTFAPATYRDYDARVVLVSNDEEKPEITVPITGSGADLPFPNIAISPGRTLVATDVPYGGIAQLAFEVQNIGDAPLDLGEITLETDAEAGVFEPAFTPTGSVPMNQHTSMLVNYQPVDEDGDFAVVHIPSNDPDTPDMTVQLVGNGGGPFEFPVAVIDCPSQVLLTGPVYAHFDGSGSSDPAGAVPLSYAWSVLFRPPGSDATIPLDPDDTPAVDLYVDVAGDWIVQLVVQNALGAVSQPAICQFSAIPEDDVHVELTWDTPSADLDLHLTQNGAPLFDVPGDCNYCNKNPDWSTSSVDDDPRLDIDDRGGFGPENINIATPADGTYAVKVHVFLDNGDTNTVATIHVWVDGVEVMVDSRVLHYDDVWDVTTINWPSKALTGGGSVGPAPERGCIR